MSAEPNWVLQQRKAFTGWCNGHLADRGLHVKVLEEELQDGWVLHELMEIISNKKIKLEAKNPKTKFQKVGNLNHVFKFLESEKIKLVNIGSEDIFTANSKLILGFIWTIILRYHVQKGGSTNAKQELLDWVNKTLEAAGSDTRVSDFKGSFSDSKAFVALVNYLKPGSVNPSGDAVEDMTNAFAAAETGLGIPNLLDAVLVNSEPDELSIMTYVSYYRAKEAQRAESKSDADASKTKAKGKGLKRAKAQKKAQFKVYTRNGDGQLVDVDNNSLKIRVTANDLQLENQTHPESKGKTKVSYTPKQPGTAKVEIEVNGTQIPESPFEVDVRDQNEVEADASKSRAYGPGLKAAQAGTPATFTVVARGPDGEKLADQLFDIEVVDANGNPVDTVTITDNGDGTYTVSYVVDQPGQYQVNVELDGEPLKGSPFSVTAGTEPVNNQCVDHKNSKAYGPGLESPKEKEPATFTVEVKDKDNEPIASGVSVQVDVSGTENPDVTVQDNGDGSFTVTYHPTKAGEYKVGVNVEEEPIQGSPFNVLVRSGLGDTKVHGPGLGHPHPNEPTHFTVEALDKDGNLMADVDLKVQVEGPNGPEDAHIKKNDDGSFTVEYTPKNKGKYRVEVQVENAPVAGSPFQVLVTPDSDASRSEAAGPGLEKPKEDVPTHFTVSVKNKDGELVGEGGSNVQVKFSGPQDHEVTVTDNSDGTYPVTYTPNKPGHYNVEVTVDGTPIAGSPFQVEVLCSADPSQCTAHGDGLKQAQQYKKAQFTIEAKDKNGAPMKVGGNDFDIKTSLPEQPSIKDNEDGTYLVSYEPQEEGENVIDVSLDGTPIAGSPFTVPTSTADASSLHSEAKGKGLEKATVGHKSNFTVQVKDVKGKPVTKESTQVEVQVEGPEGNVDTQRDAKKKGKTEFTYKPTTAGDHTISVSVNGEAVQGSPFKLNVKEGADKSKIKVSGKGKSVAFNNKPAKFKIEAQDKSGNPVDNEEFEVSIKHVESGQEGKVTIGESKEGKYPVEYEVKELGKYELSVKYGDEHVDESPYSVTCKNGAKPEKTVVSKWSFTITARTESDELVDEEEDDFQVKIDGPVEIEAKTKALGKGKYRVTYKPSKEGQYTIHITLGGVPIVGSPFVQNY